VSPQPQIKPWYKHIWPWVLMAGPIFVVIASVSMFFVAKEHTTDLVSDDYYKDGKPKDIFEVKYYRLDPNTHYYFATSYKGWQNQEEMPHDHPCYAFWKKWNIFHTTTMTTDEWFEMRDDLRDIAGQASDLESVMPHMVTKS